MKLDPNKYKYVVEVLKNAIKNNPHKSTLEVCCEISAVFHIPVAATLLLCQRNIDDNSEIRAAIQQTTKFYGYDEITELE